VTLSRSVFEYAVREALVWRSSVEHRSICGCEERLAELVEREY
jgi:hypothetical protein